MVAGLKLHNERGHLQPICIFIDSHFIPFPFPIKKRWPYLGTGKPADVAWALAPGVRWQCPHHCGTERSLQTVGKSADGRVARAPARARELQLYAWHRVRRSRLEPVLPLGVKPWLHCNARSTGVRGKSNVCICIYISIPSRYIQYIYIYIDIYIFLKKEK